ncbi:MAG: CBS domain-containing protein [Gammaproteobacteria bacterium]|nr:CBS domain-containing protein [Gammaproteobacteria bacterium]
MGYTLDQVRELTVSDVMQREILAADADWSLDMLTDFLVDNSISGAPVTENGDELVGVVSLTDIVRQNQLQDSNLDAGTSHDVYRYELERHIGHEELKIFHTQFESQVRVRDIMTPMIFSVSADTSLQEVAETMLRGRIHRVFVTSETKLTGIATTLDVLSVIRDI